MSENDEMVSAQMAAWKLMARSMVADEQRKPRQVYLGEGIWWTPPASYWRSRAAAIRQSKEPVE